MASDTTIVPPLGGPIRNHPLATTVVLSILGYALVIGTFRGLVPAVVFPDLTIGQVNRLADAIAVVNTVATLSLLAGWYWIRQDDVTKHRLAMGTGFGLILVFLVLYLTKIGGGGTKEFVGPTLPYYAYLAMLAVHILLSIVAVPLRSCPRAHSHSPGASDPNPTPTCRSDRRRFLDPVAYAGGRHLLAVEPHLRLGVRGSRCGPVAHSRPVWLAATALVVEDADCIPARPQRPSLRVGAHMTSFSNRLGFCQRTPSRWYARRVRHAPSRS